MKRHEFFIRFTFTDHYNPYKVFEYIKIRQIVRVPFYDFPRNVVIRRKRRKAFLSLFTRRSKRYYSRFFRGQHASGYTGISPLRSSLSPLYHVREHRHAYFTLVPASYARDYPANLFAITTERNRSFNYHRLSSLCFFPELSFPLMGNNQFRSFCFVLCSLPCIGSFIFHFFSSEERDPVKPIAV